MMPHCAPEKPNPHRAGEPGQRGKREDDSDGRARQPDPANECEDGESYATHRSAVGVDGSDSPAAIGAVEACAGFVLFLVSFDETGSSGEDGGESQEESAYNRTVVLRDESGDDADGSAEDEADDPLVRFDSFDCRQAGSYEHRDYLTTRQSAKETPNQIGMAERVAARAPGL